ncbi:MAG: glutamate ligase domain-containing protein, partial [Anaerolineales bacterium]
DYINSESLINENGSIGPKKLNIQIPLLGDHQIENATVAYAALNQFRQRSLSLTDDQIIHGFPKTIWQGRFEIISRNPPVILDCAHNRESIQQLVNTLQQVFPEYKPLLIFGASEDKDIQGMFADILPLVDEIIVTRSFHPRAIAAEKLQVLAEPYHKPIRVNENVAEALWLALDRIKNDQIIVITGSIFVVAEARHAWVNDPRFKTYRLA